MSLSPFEDDPVLNAIALSTVGFLKEIWTTQGTRRFVPSGSGVLVEIASIKGILTAAHVVEELEGGHAALFTIVNSKSKARRLEFTWNHTKCAVLGGRDQGPDGPDLAFVKLPPDVQARLVAENLFCNFDVRLKKAQEEDATLEDAVIAGVIEEFSEEVSQNELTRIDTHVMTLGRGEAYNFRVGGGGFDIFEFNIAHTNEVRRPTKSYGGLSGGAVWRTGATDRASERVVIGIAYRESDRDENGNRFLICHGPRCIYRELVAKLVEVFGDEFKAPSTPE